MDQQAMPARGRSPSAGHQQQQHLIRNSHSPSPHPYTSPEPNIGLGLGLDNSTNIQQFNPNDFTNFNNNSSASNQFLGTTQAPGFSNHGLADPTFDATQDFTQSFANQNLLAPTDYNGTGDFSLFPQTAQPDQFAAPLFGDSPGIGTPDLNNMTSPQTHHSPTPPHMLQPDGRPLGSAHQSPSFNQHQFASSPHQRNMSASLTPGAAFLGGQQDWTQAQFQGHRRTPSEYSDVSSAHPSPSLIAHDSFDHSPMQRASDSFDNGVSFGLNNFSISDGQILQHSRSPSHSPAISPRILPQQVPDMGQANPAFTLGGQPQGYVSAPTIAYPTSEAFPTLANDNAPVMAPPSINIDFAPNSRQNSFEPAKPAVDQDSLTPPDRGMSRFP
ncbi:DNA-binding transcription factor [Pestalotiopsis sp. 9143b]|nr:DNA-binding transcription factor [Pestalotiopsis sp. 9143b]